MRNICYTTNCVLFIKLLLQYKKWVLKTSGGLLFNLLSKLLFVIRKHVYQNKRAALAIRKMYVQNKGEAAF